MPQIYNDPINSAESTIGNQLAEYYYQKKALIDIKKDQYFSQLANVTAMPKHFGKTIKRFHYLPLLDEGNINNQGLDVSEVALATTQYDVRVPSLANSPAIIEANEASFTAAHSDGDLIWITDSSQWLLLTADTAIGYNASSSGGASGTEKSDAEVLAYVNDDLSTGNYSGDGVTATITDSVITVDELNITYETEAKAQLAVFAMAGSVMTQRSGNLYGSSKDIGTISGKLPALSETGGRVNRVGFKRTEVTGTITKFGFFDEYTQESLDFDSDAELEMHINREMLRGANEITEDALQIDLIAGAGVIKYGGSATSVSSMSGVTATLTEITYNDLMKLSTDLDNNRCPKQTTIITGSRMVDTKVIRAARVMYIGSEMVETFERMTDYHSNAAFIPLAHYAAAGSPINGEIGSVGHFRIVVVPEMMFKEGVGIAEGTNAGYKETNGRYNAYPMLVVGDESFTTIGFQTSGKTVKFKIYHKKPGESMATTADPYGETGFMSIKWYYGSMVLRSERLAVVWSVARE